jgi:hypothetical protein
MHNYLDEFLSAIRVFGFLEKPVCVPHLSALLIVCSFHLA